MNEILRALGIQWSALIAQAINFAILIVLLSRFVYKPVLRVVDERRKAIADSLAKAREIEQHGARLADERAVVLRKADEEAGELLNRAKSEAESIRKEIERSAKLRADQIVAKGIEQLDLERVHMMQELQERLAHAIVLSAEKILRREFSKEDQALFEDELKRSIPTLLAP